MDWNSTDMSLGRRNSFFKGHALGNDYVVVDPQNLDFRLNPRTVRLLCDRNRGIGGDGVVALARTRNADFGISIYNADGSEAEISGNGLRIFGLYAHSVCGSTRDRIRVETKAGVSRVRLQVGRTGEVIAAAVDMGRASFRPSDLPCTLGVPELVSQPIEIEGRMLRFTGVSVGNPHCVIFGEDGKDWSRDDLLSLGPAFECHPLFPNRINVQLASVRGDRHIRIWIWERGSGETLASGSSSCAAASAAVRLGLARSPVEVISEGGSVSVEVDDEFSLDLTGSVSSICQGILTSSFVEAAAAQDGLTG